MLTLNDPSLFREQCYVNGQWIDADDKSVIKVDNPSKGEIIGSVPKFGAAETRRAIDAAEASWAGWRALTPKERGAYLIKWNDLIQENKQDLARILSYEQGKPVAESLGEIALGSSYIPWYAEECRRTYGDVIPCLLYTSRGQKMGPRILRRCGQGEHCRRHRRAQGICRKASGPDRGVAHHLHEHS